MKIGVACSAYDLCHAGHLLYLQDARKQCDYLIAMLQIDPTEDRPEKHKPVESLDERMIRLQACKYVDEIRTYTTDTDLYKKLMQIKPDVLILGSDWIDRPLKIKECAPVVYYHNRTVHDYSSSKLRQRVMETEINDRFRLDYQELCAAIKSRQ